MTVMTPWNVEGRVDYEKIVKEFGVSLIDEGLLRRLKKHAGELHHFLRRGIFFAHRDLKFVLDEYEKGNKFFMYTGRAPSYHTHLGHVVPWLFTKWLQDCFGVDLWFQFPDEEKFLMKRDLSLEDTSKFTQENMLDVIALGFKPKNTHFLVDTLHAGVMYKEAVRVAKHITFSTVKASFGFSNEQNIGAIFYTAMQAVPSFLPSVLKGKNMPCLIPHAIDQDPHFRVSRDVLPKLGFYKPASIQCKFLPGLQGAKDEGKMSSSAGHSTTIFTTDDEKSVSTKIRKYAFSGGQATVEEHRKKGGDPSVDTCYALLTYFEEDDKKLKKIHDEYVSGALLSSELKDLTIEKVNTFLREHQEKREKARSLVDKFLQW